MSNRATNIFQLKKELKSLRGQVQAKWHRRQRKEKARKRTGFRFTKQLLGQKFSRQLTSPKSEINSYLRDTFSDAAREQDLGQSKSLINPPAPTLDLEEQETTLKKIQEAIKKA
ncbi:hypothetical protein NHX12_005578 [Muraenolepis orangiensis]|uniref:Uncharacterized protein n=1 Tax=Muraenolepis orangiensis TaxID=630683 RepID=A0A9Q0DRT0_9TELE|nr:hypothetical protein NHX12_005578 [Muraenolepis orangiensis]